VLLVKTNIFFPGVEARRAGFQSRFDKATGQALEMKAEVLPVL